jgi:hypothetical protein
MKDNPSLLWFVPIDNVRILYDYRHSLVQRLFTLMLALGAVAGLPQLASAQDDATPQGQAGTEAPTVDASELNAGPVPFQWEGQQLTFDISALGGTVARCAYNIGYEDADDNLGSVIPLRGFCVTLGLLSAFVKFNYEGFVFADPETLYPVWGEKLLEDRGRSRTYETFYERRRFVAIVERVELARDSERQYRRWIPHDVYDILTWINHVRTRDLSVGEELVYYVFDGWKLRRLTMTVTRHVDFYLGEEHPSVRAAELDVDAEVLDPYPVAPWVPYNRTIPPVYLPRGGDDTKLGEAWFALEGSRVPLGLNLGTPFGKMRIRVQDIPE